MQGILIGKNRAKLSKLRNDVVITQDKLREAGPQAKDEARDCTTGHKLRWNGTTWSCLEESDHHINPFAEQDLPDCPSGYVLTPASTTSLECAKPDKGPIGPAPTWRKPNGGNNLQIANPNGTWGSSVNIRGDGGDKYTWYTGSYGSCSEDCGPGTRTRIVECRKNMYTPVADGNCAAPKPTTTTSCNLGGCFTYSYTSWSANCPFSCDYSGNGINEDQYRSCKRSDGVTVDCAQCGGYCHRHCYAPKCKDSCNYTYVISGNPYDAEMASVMGDAKCDGSNGYYGYTTGSSSNCSANYVRFCCDDGRMYPQNTRYAQCN